MPGEALAAGEESRRLLAGAHLDPGSIGSFTGVLVDPKVSENVEKVTA